MTPMAVLQVMAMNGDPRAVAAIAAAKNVSDQNNIGNTIEEQFSQTPNSIGPKPSSSQGGNLNLPATFGNTQDRSGPSNRLSTRAAQSFGGNTKGNRNAPTFTGHEILKHTKCESGPMETYHSGFFQHRSFQNSQMHLDNSGSRQESKRTNGYDMRYACRFEISKTVSAV